MIFYAYLLAGISFVLALGAILTFACVAAAGWWMAKPEPPKLASHARAINEHAQAVADHARALALMAHSQHVVDAAKANVDAAAALAVR